ncbi:hypothetical protein X798_03139 [Onchocerca flexuosa]|uniref:Uncharacterized protein n=2 Tax=Onchocerca flexuosa TaxID=387005 RepID=A0A183GZU8_9BILA|nr:hypothetical protein X798_03139 [Onchocerca flexuosa]VDO26964.1 unnamed protein product [Onchocerca flexuosa]
MDGAGTSRTMSRAETFIYMSDKNLIQNRLQGDFFNLIIIKISFLCYAACHCVVRLPNATFPTSLSRSKATRTTDEYLNN